MDALVYSWHLLFNGCRFELTGSAAVRAWLRILSGGALHTDHGSGPITLRTGRRFGRLDCPGAVAHRTVRVPLSLELRRSELAFHAQPARLPRTVLHRDPLRRGFLKDVIQATAARAASTLARAGRRAGAWNILRAGIHQFHNLRHHAGNGLESVGNVVHDDSARISPDWFRIPAIPL